MIRNKLMRGKDYCELSLREVLIGMISSVQIEGICTRLTVGRITSFQFQAGHLP